MGFWGFATPRICTVVLLSAALSGCLQNTGVVSKTFSTSLQANNCPVPSAQAQAAKNIGRRLAASGQSIDADFCSRTESYSCFRRVFSPSAPDSQGVEEECTHLSELGGDLCLSLSSRSYNTQAAAALPETSAASLQPGGEFNRSEYVCHHKDLRDADQFLAVGNGEQLKEALTESHTRCLEFAPRLLVGGEK